MKYVVILGDGMADYPIPQLGNKTPLQYSKKPNMDFLAKHGEIGIVKTIPDGIPPGSDTANLSVMGYNPETYYTGRSSLEAVSMGINLADTDVTFRCNLVTLSDSAVSAVGKLSGTAGYAERTMIDYSSDEISSAEAGQLITEINNHFRNEIFIFYPGISYRHCMVWKNGPNGFILTPPHDILERRIAKYLPQGKHGRVLLDMMVESSLFLKEHPVNRARVERGLNPANSIWLWGEAKKPALPEFYKKYGINGSVISAVDLIKGIGICAGLKSINVEGATGNIHTNFHGKADSALLELEKGSDFVYIHVEAPDECGHRYEIENKVKSIELIDEQVVGTVLKGLEKYSDYKILILPDHPTPLSLRTHTPEPVPYLLYGKSSARMTDISGYDEFQAKISKKYIDKGYTLMDYFINHPTC